MEPKQAMVRHTGIAHAMAGGQPVSGAIIGAGHCNLTELFMRPEEGIDSNRVKIGFLSLENQRDRFFGSWLPFNANSSNVHFPLRRDSRFLQ